jgi:hypothetical protein
MPSVYENVTRVLCYFSHLLSSVSFKLTLFYMKLEVAGFSESLVSIYQTARRYVPKESNVKIHGLTNIESHL